MNKTSKVKNGHLYVASAGKKGRGVFTTKKIRKGELIELCPVIELSHKEHMALAGFNFSNYPFDWNTPKKSVAILFGFGSLYNHSSEPNADYIKDLRGRIMKFVASRTINVGEEITIDYGEEHVDLHGLS